MSVDVVYPWLKAFHVAAALTFVGGVLATSIVLAAFPAGEYAPGPGAVARRMRRWDRAVTTPAMLLVWACGLGLAMTGHWFGDAWLQAKFGIVLALSGLHGVQSGRLRRLGSGSHGSAFPAAPAVIVCAIAIAVLAVLKPF